MTDKPSDHALSQAFYKLVERLRLIGDTATANALMAVEDHAREIDAAAPDGAQAVGFFERTAANEYGGFKWGTGLLNDVAAGLFPVGRTLLYTAPSPQVVDLERFRHIVQKERTRLANSVDKMRWQLSEGLRPEVREKIKTMFDEDQLMLGQADDLLELIDGQSTAPPTQEAEEPEAFYLASFKRHRIGAAILWWMPDNAGYTPDLQQAGVYSEIRPDYHESSYTVPVPTWFMDGCRIRHEIDPGDSENVAFWSADKLRAAIAEATTARAAPNPNNKASPNG